MPGRCLGGPHHFSMCRNDGPLCRLSGSVCRDDFSCSRAMDRRTRSMILCAAASFLFPGDGPTDPIHDSVCRANSILFPDDGPTDPINDPACPDKFFLFPDDVSPGPANDCVFRNDVFCSRTMSQRNRPMIPCAATFKDCRPGRSEGPALDDNFAAPSLAAPLPCALRPCLSPIIRVAAMSVLYRGEISMSAWRESGPGRSPALPGRSPWRRSAERRILADHPPILAAHCRCTRAAERVLADHRPSWRITVGVSARSNASSPSPTRPG